MSIEYNNKAIYNQLLYLKSIFDVDKAKSKSLKPLAIDDENFKSASNQGEVNALAEQNRSQFQIYQKVIQKYLDVNGRRFVDLGSIFRNN